MSTLPMQDSGINWDTIGSGLLNAGLNYWSGSLSNDVMSDAANAAAGSDAKRRAAYQQYAAQLQGLAPSVSAGYALKPATATTAFAKSMIDPATGKVGYELTPETQGLFSGYMGGAQKSLDLAGGMDPRAMAAERLAKQQELLAPQRAAEEAKLMRTMQSKGLFGLGSYEGAPEGVGAQNPMMAALMGARAQADKRAAYESLGEGEAYLDRLLKRSQGLFDSAQDVESTGKSALHTAYDWTDRFTRSNREQTNAVTGLLQSAYEAQRQGAYDPASEKAMLEAQKAAAAQKALQTGSAIKAGGGMLQDILKQAGGITGLLKGIAGGSAPAVRNLEETAKALGVKPEELQQMAEYYSATGEIPTALDEAMANVDYSDLGDFSGGGDWFDSGAGDWFDSGAMDWFDSGAADFGDFSVGDYF